MMCMKNIKKKSYKNIKKSAGSLKNLFQQQEIDKIGLINKW